jgi:hypothetical protein
MEAQIERYNKRENNNTNIKQLNKHAPHHSTRHKYQDVASTLGTTQPP